MFERTRETSEVSGSNVSTVASSAALLRAVEEVNLEGVKAELSRGARPLEFIVSEGRSPLSEAIFGYIVGEMNVWDQADDRQREVVLDLLISHTKEDVNLLWDVLLKEASGVQRVAPQIVMSQAESARRAQQVTDKLLKAGCDPRHKYEGTPILAVMISDLPARVYDPDEGEEFSYHFGNDAVFKLVGATDRAFVAGCFRAAIEGSRYRLTAGGSGVNSGLDPLLKHLTKTHPGWDLHMFEDGETILTALANCRVDWPEDLYAAVICDLVLGNMGDRSSELINKKNNHGKSPLMLALERGNYSLALSLVNGGADTRGAELKSAWSAAIAPRNAEGLKCYRKLNEIFGDSLEEQISGSDLYQYALERGLLEARTGLSQGSAAPLTAARQHLADAIGKRSPSLIASERGCLLEAYRVALRGPGTENRNDVTETATIYEAEDFRGFNNAFAALRIPKLLGRATK